MVKDCRYKRKTMKKHDHGWNVVISQHLFSHRWDTNGMDRVTHIHITACSMQRTVVEQWIWICTAYWILPWRSDSRLPGPFMAALYNDKCCGWVHIRRRRDQSISGPTAPEPSICTQWEIKINKSATIPAAKNADEEERHCVILNQHQHIWYKKKRQSFSFTFFFISRGQKCNGLRNVWIKWLWDEEIGTNDLLLILQFASLLEWRSRSEVVVFYLKT